MKTPTYSRSDFAPATRVGGYLPTEDVGLGGDGSSAALVGGHGTVAWLYVPRSHDHPLFRPVPDARRGGRFRPCAS